MNKEDSWKSRFLISELVVGSGEQDNNLQLSGGLIFVEVPLGLSCKSSGQYSIANEHSMIKNFTIKVAINVEKFKFGYDIVTCHKAQDCLLQLSLYALYGNYTLAHIIHQNYVLLTVENILYAYDCHVLILSVHHECYEQFLWIISSLPNMDIKKNFVVDSRNALM